MVRKTTISSVLSQDFGIEDFERGVFQKPKNNLKAFELSNKLGLLAPLADRYNTDPISFGNEAYNLLSEAIMINKFVKSQMTLLNERFAIAAEVKKNYGVEGFDPFAFGSEDIKEKLKAGFNGLVSFVKKLIMSISNWIKGVLNWAGSQVAKKQAEFAEKYKLESFKNKDFNLKIDTIVPKKFIKSGHSIMYGFNNGIEEYNKFINSAAIKESAFIELLNKFKGEDPLIDKMQKIANEIDISDQKIIFTSYYDEKINIIKNDSKKLANRIMYGYDNPPFIEIDVSEYLNDFVNWRVILSRDDLKDVEELVKSGKNMIKTLNMSLKNLDMFFKQNSEEKSKIPFLDKYRKEKYKLSQLYIRFINERNIISGLLANTLYDLFSNYLKLRSTIVSAMRLYIVNKTSKKNKMINKNKSTGHY